MTLWSSSMAQEPLDTVAEELPRSIHRQEIRFPSALSRTNLLRLKVSTSRSPPSLLRQIVSKIDAWFSIYFPPFSCFVRVTGHFNDNQLANTFGQLAHALNQLALSWQVEYPATSSRPKVSASRPMVLPSWLSAGWHVGEVTNAQNEHLPNASFP